MDDRARILLPVPGLNLSRPWNVGTVRFHPGDAVAGLIQDTQQGPQGRGPEWYAELVAEKGDELGRSAVAEITAADVTEAISLVDGALAALRIV